MQKFNQLHKLFTYTDKTLIKINPNEILVYVYAKAVLSEELEKIRHYPREEVTEYPICIEVRFPVSAVRETTEHILASAEALAQVAAVSPEFYNIFGTKKGVNITDVLLVASQKILEQFAGYEAIELSKVSNQCLSLSSVFFYGAATRLAKKGENDWVKPLLTGEEEPYAIYNTSSQNVYERLCIENKGGKFFVTRKAIEDFLALPHRFTAVDTVTRPFKAVRGVFGQVFKEPIPGSPYAPSEMYNEQGRRNKVLLAPAVWRLRLVMVEEEIFGEPVYIVKGMPAYILREEMEEYKKNDADQIANTRKIREYLKEKQLVAVTGELG